jgi:hypothetical protein
MLGLKLLGSTCFVAAADATAALPIGTTEKFGIIAMLLAATVALWRDAGKRQDKLEKIIETNMQQSQHVIDVIEKCKGKNG